MHQTMTPPRTRAPRSSTSAASAESTMTPDPDPISVTSMPRRRPQTAPRPGARPLPKKTSTAEDRQRAFGNAVREALAVQKMTQGDLAEALGVRQPTVSGWITGISAPDSVDQTFAVERALKVRPGSLSRHLGYLPPESVKSVATVRAAVMEDPQLSADEKSMILAAYDAATRTTRRKG